MEEIEEKTYSDHTGLIPNTSNRRMNYVMIFIFMMLTTLKVSQSKIALKTSSIEHMRKKYAKLSNKGYHPKFH